MKKILIICFFGFLAFIGNSQTLTFKFGNPRLSNDLTNNWFSFDIFIKADAGGSYLYGSQIYLNTTIGNINTTITPTTNISGTFIGNSYSSQPEYSVVTCHYVSSRLFIAINHNTNFDANYPAAYAAVTTTYQKLCTVSVCLVVGGETGTAGITFFPFGMDGYQYKGNGSPGGILYNSPNLYDSKDFSDIYYGRIYSGGAGDMYASYWSQWGGSVNWSVSENTSVWDTTATSAILSSTGNTCGALRVHPGARLTIGPIGDLTASGNSEINEVRGLNIQADATGMGQFLDNGTIAYNTGGSVQAECRFQQDRWHEYCSPFASTNARPYYLMYMKYYQEPSDHWKYVWNDGWWPTDTILDGTKMTGYAMWAASTGPYINSGMVRPYGSLNTGNVNATITWSTYSGGGHNGYNLVGNPYPSAIDLHDAGIGWGAITKSAWIYDPALHDYRTWLYGGGGTYGSGSNIIAPQQGFIIRGTIASDVFGMVNAARRINHMTFVKDQPEIYDRLVLDVSCSQNTYGDEMAVRFLDSAKPSYDDMYDAYKLYGASEAPQLYSIIPGDSTLTVNSLPWSGINQVVPLGFQCGTNDSFTITASNLQTFRSGVVIYLEDTANAGGGFYNLTLNNNYSFTANAGTSNGRFFLHFYNPFFGVNEHTDAGLQIYSFDSYVYVKNHFQGVTSGVITIYDMIGKTVFQNNLKNANLNKFNPGLMQGYYIVKVVTAENVYTQKVYLK